MWNSQKQSPSAKRNKSKLTHFLFFSSQRYTTHLSPPSEGRIIKMKHAHKIMNLYLCHLFFKILFKILNNTISDMKKLLQEQFRCTSTVPPFLTQTVNGPPKRNDGLPCLFHLYTNNMPTSSPGFREWRLTYIRGYVF